MNEAFKETNMTSYTLQFDPYHVYRLAYETIAAGEDKWIQPYSTEKPNHPIMQLVGDDGVYWMSGVSYEDHIKNEEGKADVCYAHNCNPHTQDFDEWWDAKQMTFGGDDGVDSIEAFHVARVCLRCIANRQLLFAVFDADMIELQPGGVLDTTSKHNTVSKDVMEIAQP